mmetsp:Transcript_27747/g.73299  ORF Transcript_27747/g.73299 Transcript_27747/m.73299 type:complete len:346 (+) Transcript_27747:60-1097(+)
MELKPSSLDLQFIVWAVVIYCLGALSVLLAGRLWSRKALRDDRNRPALQTKTHVVLLSDDQDILGLLACLNSIVRNCRTPDALCVHVGISSLHVDLYTNCLKENFAHKVGFLEVVNLRTAPSLTRWFDDLIELMPKTSKRYTINMVNYSRFFVLELFPGLMASSDSLFAYVDSDKIVYGDIHELCADLQSKRADRSPALFVGTNVHYRTAFAAVGSTGRRMTARFACWCALHGVNPFGMAPYNAGFYVSSPGPWADTAKQVTELIQGGLREVVMFDTQPLMILLFRNIVRRVDWTWNSLGYGWRSDLEIDRATMKSIHWNGASKGWNPDNKFHSYWKEYEVPVFH